MQNGKHIKALVLVLLMAVTSCSTADPADRAFEQGRAFQNQGRHSDAVTQFNKSITLDPKNPTAYTSRGVSYEQLGQYQNAIDDYDNALKSDPKMVLAYYHRAKAYRELRQFQKAIDDSSKAIVLDQNYLKAYCERAYAYNQIGQFQASLADCNMAIARDPNNSFAYSCRAVAHGGLGQDDKAIDDIHKPISVAGSAADAADLVTLAALLDKKGRYAEADALYEKAERQSATHYEPKHGPLEGDAKVISVCRARRLLQEMPEEQAVKEFPWSKEYLSDKKRGTLSYVREFVIVPLRLRSVRDFRSGSTGNAILVQDARRETASRADRKLQKREPQKAHVDVRQKVGSAGDSTVVQGIQTAGTFISEDTARRYLARLNREQALTNFKWSKDFLSVGKDDDSPPLSRKSPSLVGRGPSSLRNFLSFDGLIISNEDYAKLKKMARL